MSDKKPKRKFFREMSLEWRYFAEKTPYVEARAEYEALAEWYYLQSCLK